jgi:hypothetical protein
MPSRTYTVRLKDEDAALLATDYGSASAGVRAAVTGLVNLLRIEAKPAGPEIPTAAPVKARKAKPAGNESLQSSGALVPAVPGGRGTPLPCLSAGRRGIDPPGAPG